MILMGHRLLKWAMPTTLGDYFIALYFFHLLSLLGLGSLCLGHVALFFQRIFNHDRHSVF